MNGELMANGSVYLQSGFFPGSCAISRCNATTVIPQCSKPKYGKMLKDINDNRQREAERIVSFYSEGKN